MTATVPRIGLRARLSRGAGVLAVAAAALTVLIPGAALAATDDVAAAPEDIVLVLAPQDGGISRSGTAVSVVLRIADEGSVVLGETQAALELGQDRLDDAETLATWLGTGQSTGGFRAVGSVPTPAVPAGTEANVDLTVTTAVLTGLEPGVYPLRARLTGFPGPEARSVIVVAETRRGIALLVPITLTPADGILLTAEELAAATAADGVLTALIDALAGTSAAFALDPSIPAAIRALGTTAPDSAVSWLETVETLPNERFALQFADADATAQAQAGLDQPLHPPALTSFLDPANLPATDGDDAEPELPSLAELSDIRTALPGLLWPRGEVVPDDLARFAAYFGSDTTTVLPDTSAEGATAAYAADGGHRTLLYDTSGSNALAQAISEPDAASRAAALAAATARITLIDGETPLLLALERDEARDGVALGETIRALEALGTPLTLTDLQEIDPAPVTIETPGAPERAAALAPLLADERRIVAFSSVLQDPAVLTDRERLRLLRLIGVGEPAGGFSEALTAHRERTRTILGSVSIQPSSDVQILSASVDLPVGVRNDLPWPIAVTLTARPADPRLDVQSETVVELPPQSISRERVPVQARVGSGEVDVHLALTSTTGEPIGQPEVIRVIVRAEWESIGLTVLGGIVVLLLTFGVIRTVRRRRRADAAASGSDAPRGDDE